MCPSAKSTRTKAVAVQKKDVDEGASWPKIEIEVEMERPRDGEAGLAINEEETQMPRVGDTGPRH